ncbi:sterol desaturase/sphingolipid hydroxylase (fatty acid hydroxylase superfamily) [Pedobacter sp. UYP30]|uniref:sterol desaturase family protein n=1 Tax=Pedobacter sp. UYP30 TaxID=1756400 RepID=UPI003399D950
MGIIKKVFDLKGVPILAVVCIILFIAERKKPLRKQRLKLKNRLITNTAVAAPSFLLARLIFIPTMVAIARHNQHRHSRIFTRGQKDNLQPLIAFLLMDLASYIWHNLNHKIPLLWRFHVVHHTDLDLDLSTAIRFHFGEMVGSIFFRGFFVWLSGATPLNVLIYEIIFEAETQFHHSNLKLNNTLEKALNLIIVTPRMHGIHHSNQPLQTDSNYAVIFSFWDKIFHTHNLNRTQESITIGAPFIYNSTDFSIRELLKMPFV